VAVIHDAVEYELYDEDATWASGRVSTPSAPEPVPEPSTEDRLADALGGARRGPRRTSSR
jgi:hypothetical protein